MTDLPPEVRQPSDISFRRRFNTWVTRYVALLAAIALFHQWLGQRFRNHYFGGDAIQFLLTSSRIADNTPPGLLSAVESKSPMSTLLYAVMLRVTHTTAQLIPQGLTLIPDVWVHLFAGLATLICLLTGRVTWRYTGSPAAGFVAMLLAGLYAPFVINAERALTEAPFTIFALLTFLCIHEALTRPSFGYGVLTGGCFFLMLATRIQYLTPLLGCALLIFLVACVAVATRLIICARRDGDPRDLRGAARWRNPEMRRLLTIGVVALATTLFLFAGATAAGRVPPERRYTGTAPNLLLQQSPFAYALTDGWARDGTYLPVPTPNAPEPERNAQALIVGGALPCPTTDGQYRVLLCLMRRSPGFTAQRIAISEFRLWWYPHNDFHVQVGAITALLPAYHRLLVALGLAGLLLFALQRRRGTFLAIPILFIAAVFSIQHIEVRYAIPTMPFLIASSASLLVTLAAALRPVWDTVRARQCPRAIPWLVAVPAALCAAAVLMLGGRFLFMAYGATRAAVLVTRIIPLGLLMTCGLIALFRLSGARRALGTLGVLAACAIFAVAVVSLASASSDTWSVTLSSDRQEVTQKILLPAAPASDRQMAVLLDVQPLDGDLSGLIITLNGYTVPVADSEQSVVALTRQQLPSYYRWSFDLSHGARDATRIPQWVAIPVPMEWVRGGENDIVVRLRPGRPPAVRIFGQFSPSRNRELTMPGLFQTSLWKDGFDADPRIAQPVTLQGDARYSLYREDDGAFTYDLSPARGIQHGTYHIFLGMLTPSYIESAANVPPDAFLNGQLRLAPAGAPIDTFWFYATASRDARVTILDEDRTTLIAFPAGQATAQQWYGDLADAAYAPLLSARTDPLFRDDPGNRAVQQWSARFPAGSAPDRQTSERFTGAYVVHLHGPARSNTLFFVVTPTRDADGTSWQTLVPSHEPGTATPPTTVYVDIVMSTTGVENVGYAAPSAEQEPIFLMVHIADGQLDGTVTQAAGALGVGAPSAVYVPISAPNVHNDDTPRGPVQSSWVYASRVRASVRILLA